MKRTLRWTSLALSDLDAVYQYLSEQEAAASAIASQLLLIEAAVQTLAAFHSLSRKGRVKSTRELPVSGTPYIVAYSENKTQIDILAIIHGARRWPSTL